MSSRYSERNLRVVKDMRLLERELFELHTRIRIYTSIYERSYNKIEALKIQCRELNGDQYASELEAEPEYQRALEKMSLAKRRLETLERERETVKRQVQDAMQRT